jgi:serine/threonine protein kinase
MKITYFRRVLYCVLVSIMALHCSLLAGASEAIPPSSAHGETVLDQAVDENRKNEEISQAIIDRLITSVARWLTETLGIEAEGVNLFATGILGAPVLLAGILIILLLRRQRHRGSRRKGRSGRPMGLPSKKADDDQLNLMSLDSALTDKQRILKFFFNLYKRQINAAPNAPTELFLVETRPTCPDETYEMRVLQNGEWTIRRMSIGLLGQGGGSRSKCFYVIYGSHMVIKLPAEPITQFRSYNRQIAAEAAIVNRLKPRECIVPRVSVILKSVQKIPYSQELSSDEIEKKYVHLLEVKPTFQKNLKIGGSFALFMDLAKHFFLSNTLEEIHHGHTSIAQEAKQHPDLIWDQRGFVGRYGEEAGSVCHVLKEAFYNCEPELERLIEKAAIIDDVPQFRLKQWFMVHLAGEQLHPGKEDLPDDLIGKVNALLRKVVKNHQGEVNRYRIGVNAYIRDLHFSRHRSQLEGLSTNTLDLLEWLGSHDLALRDLKPENLFVAGNPDEYPLFLGNPAKFTIGLIDVETAVVINHKDKSKTPQPQLAGTPLYATPSHLFSNTLLDTVYDDFLSIFHLQDWYATIAIIYKIITGENLFINTAGAFPEIIRRLKKLDPTAPSLDTDIGQINQIFWNSAAAELKDAIQKHLSLFLQVEVAVPQPFVPIIIKALHRDADRLNLDIKAIIEEQNMFTSPEKCNFLKRASAEKIGQMKNRLVQDIQRTTGKDDQKDKLLKLLDCLVQQKAHLQRKLEAAAALKAAQSPISADQLLEAMFQHVYSHMYLSHWPTLNPSKFDEVGDQPMDIATYQATMEQATIGPETTIFN